MSIFPLSSLEELTDEGLHQLAFQVEQEIERRESESCRECGDATDDGEGYDGLCGNCADKAEKESA